MLVVNVVHIVLAGSLQRIYGQLSCLDSEIIPGRRQACPDRPRLEYIVKGFRRRAAQGGGRPRLPVTLAILRGLKGVWLLEPDWFTASMLWAAACLCFFGFLRFGEVVVLSDAGFDPTVHLCFEDVSIDSRVAH